MSRESRSGSRRERERRRRLARFVDIAQELFFSGGFDGITIDEVARQAEFSKRTVYLYFANKEDLFHAVVHRGIVILETMLAEQEEPEWSGLDEVVAKGRAYAEFARRNEGYFRALTLYESREYFHGKSGAELPPFSRACVETLRKVDRHFHAPIERGLLDNSIVSPLSPQQLTLLLWGQTLGVIQVLQMRRESLPDYYDISESELGERFVESIRRQLAP